MPSDFSLVGKVAISTTLVQASNGTASTHSICYSDPQVNHRPSEASARLEEEDESYLPGQIRHFDTEQQALWSPWPEANIVWNDESILNGTVNATQPDAQMYASTNRDPVTEAGPWNTQTHVATAPAVHDVYTYSSTSAWASDSITTTHFDTIMEYEDSPTAGYVIEIDSDNPPPGPQYTPSQSSPHPPPPPPTPLRSQYPRQR